MFNKSCIIIFILLCALISGCSVSSPTSPSQPEKGNTPEDAIEALNGLSLGFQQLILAGTMEIDPSNPEGKINQDRDNEWNFNITSFLGGGCPGGCFSYQIVGIVGEVFEIELTIENPSSMQAYDVRLIYESLHGKTVLNPDSYTDIFKPYNIRPFTAFAKEYTDRAFPIGPGATDTETLFLEIPPGSPAYVEFIIIASFPGLTEDPYEINGMDQDGTLTPSGGTSVISCFAMDHQRDVSSVAVDTTPLTGGITQLDPASGVDYLWFKEITNSEGAPAGTYKCLIRAQSSNPQNAATYNYIEIVVEEQTIPWNPIEEVHLSDYGWYSVDPDLAYDSDGFAHVCWTEVENVGLAQWNENIWYSNNVSGSWSTPVEVSDAFQNVNDYIVSPSKIAINNQDQICIVWTQELYNGDRPKLWCSFYDGTNWSGQTQMFDLYSMEVQPQLCSADHFFYLAFRLGHESGSIMFSKWNTIEWSEPVPVSDPIDSLYLLQMDGSSAITAASRGGCFITWLFYDYNPDGIYQVMMSESWDGGATWSADFGGIPDEFLASGKPSIAMNGSGHLYELWQSEMDRIMWDTNNSSGWGVDRVLYNHYGASYPSFDVMTNSHQHVVFVDAKIIPIPMLYIESLNGISWTSPVQISPADGECEMPSVDTYGLSRVGVAWKHHSGGYSNDILYRERNF